MHALHPAPSQLLQFSEQGVQTKVVGLPKNIEGQDDTQLVWNK